MSYIKKPSVVKIDPTVTHLQPDQFDNDDPIQGYPFGTSAMRVTTATGFPEISGDVITSRTTDGTGSQIFVGEKAYIRTFEASAWSSWRELGESSGGSPVEWDDIINKPSQFPPSPHTHVIEDTIGLQAALDEKASAQSVNELQQEIAAHKAESTQNAHLAKNIGIEDTAGHFTASDVESALAELFTFANDGKTGIAAVIGSPATSGDTFSQLQTHIQNAKNTMATNLTEKGVSASGTEALQALADKIANVPTGMRWASGTGSRSSVQNTFLHYSGSVFNYLDYYFVEVTGLNFLPSVILLRGTSSREHVTVVFPVPFGSDSQEFRCSIKPVNGVFSVTYNAYISSSGFKLPVSSGSSTYNWWAFE